MIAIVQPCVPAYREEFFLELKKRFSIDVYVLSKNADVRKKGFNLGRCSTKYLKNFRLGNLTVYDVIPLLNTSYDIVVLMGSVRHLSLWLVLVFF